MQRMTGMFERDNCMATGLGSLLAVSDFVLFYEERFFFLVSDVM